MNTKVNSHSTWTQRRCYCCCCSEEWKKGRRLLTKQIGRVNNNTHLLTWENENNTNMTIADAPVSLIIWDLSSFPSACCAVPRVNREKLTRTHIFLFFLSAVYSNPRAMVHVEPVEVTPLLFPLPRGSMWVTFVRKSRPGQHNFCAIETRPACYCDWTERKKKNDPWTRSDDLESSTEDYDVIM